MKFINIEIRFLLFIQITFLAALLYSCGNNQAKAITAETAEFPLNKIFKEAYTAKLTQSDIIRKSEVKEVIIREYSEKFYNKVLENTQVVFPVQYDSIQNVYECDGWLAHSVGFTGAVVRYNAGNDELVVKLQIDGYLIKETGEFD